MKEQRDHFEVREAKDKEREKKTRGQTKKKSYSKGEKTKTYIDFHFSVESIVQEKVVGHANTMGLHGVARAVVIVPDIRCGSQESRACHRRNRTHTQNK